MNTLTPLCFGNQPLKPGSYQVSREHENLIFPCDLQRFFKAHYLRNTGEAIGFLFSFPSTVAAELNWSIEEVTHANDELKIIIDWMEPEYTPRVYGFNVGVDTSDNTNTVSNQSA